MYFHVIAGLLCLYRHNTTTLLFHSVVDLQTVTLTTVNLRLLMTEKRTKLGFNEELFFRDWRKQGCTADVCIGFCSGCVFNLLFSNFHLFTKMIPNEKSYSPPGSATNLFFHHLACASVLFSVPPFFLHSSFIDPSIVDQLCVTNVYCVLREASRTWTKVPNWWGSSVANLSPANALLILTIFLQ